MLTYFKSDNKIDGIIKESNVKTTYLIHTSKHVGQYNIQNTFYVLA
jgi:hypothetical protein